MSFERHFTSVKIFYIYIFCESNIYIYGILLHNICIKIISMLYKNS